MHLEYVLCVVVTISVVNSAVVSEKIFSLDIIHYNDFHDRFEETSVPYAVCQTNNTSCLGGFARLAHEIKLLREEKPDAVLLNAGDVFQGTYWYSLLKWNVTAHFLNMLPHDAHAIGNHEFDDGIAGVAPLFSALQAPVLAANIDNSLEPLLDGLIKPHTIVKRRGRKIGIIGVSTVESQTSSRPGKLIFLDPVKIVSEEAQLLTDRGVDIIIVLSHCGIHIDQDIAREAGENVDIIVGGHSHSLLWNGPTPSDELASGPYPMEVESKRKPGHKVLIVQAAAYTKYLGNITLYMNSKGDVVKYDARPIFLNRSIPEDQDLKALLQTYKTKLYEIVHEVVGWANDNLIYNTCSRMECAIGNFFADAFADATKQAFPSNYTDISLVLKHTIRASLVKGAVTRGDLINLSPFTNKVVSIVLPGRYILEALERCVSVSWVNDPFQSPYMPSVSGMQVTLNITSRSVASVLVNHATGSRPLNLDEEYRLTIIDFIYYGGSKFDMFLNNSREFKIIGKDFEVLEKYLRKATPLSDKLDNRLILIK